MQSGSKVGIQLII